MPHDLFFPSVNGDRPYKTVAWAAWARWLCTTGVSAHPVDSMQVIAGEGMSVIVLPGGCNIDGRIHEHDEAVVIPLEGSDGQYDRIDRIVARCDHLGRWFVETVKTGFATAAPEPQPLQWDQDYKELCLAEVHIPRGALAITDQHITDTRHDETLCGIARAKYPLETGKLFAQYRAMFEATMGDLHAMLDGDAASNLANQIFGGASEPYTHSYDTINGVHNFVGAGRPVGRALITAMVGEGDTFAVNGVPVPAYMGEDLVDALPVGRWATFINSGNQLDFTGGGGGGAWRVRAVAELPAIVTDRTIAVVTDVPMAGAVISTAQPTTPTEGLVWIRVAPVRHQATMSGYGIVRFVNAFIYASGAWASARAFYSVAGAWVELGGMLFLDGVEGVPWSGGDDNIGSGVTRIVENTGGMLHLRLTATSGTNAASYITTDQVDLTPYSFLRANIASTLAGLPTYMTVSTSRAIRPSGVSGAPLQNVLASAQIASNGMVSLGIGNVNGLQYVGFTVGVSSTTSYTADLTVQHVWLE